MLGRSGYWRAGSIGWYNGFVYRQEQWVVWRIIYITTANLSFTSTRVKKFSPKNVIVNSNLDGLFSRPF